MDQKKATGMKEREKKMNKEKKGKYGTEQSYTLHSCHVLAHFIVFLSAAPTSMQTAQKSGAWAQALE